MTDRKEPKIIKRYQNRKLYDTVDSCYVTLEDIRDMIKMGEDVRVIDNATKEDLTSVTFAQIIFEEEKKRRPVNLFAIGFRRGYDVLQWLQNRIPKLVEMLIFWNREWIHAQNPFFVQFEQQWILLDVVEVFFF